MSSSASTVHHDSDDLKGELVVHPTHIQFCCRFPNKIPFLESQSCPYFERQPSCWVLGVSSCLTKNRTFLGVPGWENKTTAPPLITQKPMVQYSEISVLLFDLIHLVADKLGKSRLLMDKIRHHPRMMTIPLFRIQMNTGVFLHSKWCILNLYSK